MINAQEILMEAPAIMMSNRFIFARRKTGNLQLSSTNLTFIPDGGEALTISIDQIKSVVMSTPMRVKVNNNKYFFDLTFATVPSYWGAQFALSGSKGGFGVVLLERKAHLNEWTKQFRAVNIKTYDHTLNRMTPWLPIFLIVFIVVIIGAWIGVGLLLTRLLGH